MDKGTHFPQRTPKKFLTTSNIDQVVSHTSANLQGNNYENIFLLADVAMSKSKSKLPSFSEDCSSLEMLADVCEQMWNFAKKVVKWSELKTE